MNWAILTWFPDHGVEKVHGDDIEILGNGVSGLIVPVIAIDDEWVIIEVIHERIRVHPSLLMECNEPKFKLGELVTTVPPRSIRMGVISSIVWHFERNEPIYHLTIGGVVHRSRYFSNELRDA